MTDMNVYVGIDVHSEECYVTAMRSDGSIYTEGTTRNFKEGIRHYFAAVPTPNIKIAIEACGLWRGFYRDLTNMGYNVVLANPVQVHDVVKKMKTDQRDATAIADMLRCGYLQKIYIPDEKTLKLRDLARHEAQLRRLRASLRVRIKSYLKRDGDFRKFKWNKEVMKELRSKPLISNFVTLIEAIDPEIKKVSKMVKMVAINNDTTRILQTVPGIGEFSSLMIMAEIGDIRRFDNPKSFVSYCGLGTGTYQSADTTYTVNNNAVNKWLKWVFRMSSGRAIMKSTAYLAHYVRVKNRRGYKIARKSVARKMATDVWHMLTNNEVYKENS